MGGQTQGQGAKTGVETVTEIGMVSTWGWHIRGGGGIKVDRHMAASRIRGVGSGQSGWRNAPPSQRRGANLSWPEQLMPSVNPSVKLLPLPFRMLNDYLFAVMGNIEIKCRFIIAVT